MRSFRFFLCPCTPLRASSYQKCPLLMRVKGQRVVCLEGAGSPGHTQSLTLALYLNQALGFQLPLSKAILLTSSRALISFCHVICLSELEQRKRAVLKIAVLKSLFSALSQTIGTATLLQTRPYLKY